MRSGAGLGGPAAPRPSFQRKRTSDCQDRAAAAVEAIAEAVPEGL